MSILTATRPVAPAHNYQLAGLPEGIDGVRATLGIMRQLVKAFRVHPRILELARQIIEGVPQKAFAREAEAIFKWVRSNIRYTQDIDGVETLQSPIATLDSKHGDCDDQATLLAALLNAAGHPARFVAIGFEPDRFEHVIVETLVGDQWLPADTTEPDQFGTYPWNPADVVTKIIVSI